MEAPSGRSVQVPVSDEKGHGVRLSYQEHSQGQDTLINRCLPMVSISGAALFAVQVLHMRAGMQTKKWTRLLPMQQSGHPEVQLNPVPIFPTNAASAYHTDPTPVRSRPTFEITASQRPEANCMSETDTPGAYPKFRADQSRHTLCRCSLFSTPTRLICQCI